MIRFLDRYVFKNPKKLENKKVQKKNDPLAQRAGYTPIGVRALPVDSAAYLDESEERIPVDELFLYRYLKQKGKKHVKKEDDDDDEDLDSVNSEEFNDMLDHMSGGQNFDDLDIAANILPKKKKGNVLFLQMVYVRCVSFIKRNELILFARAFFSVSYINRNYVRYILLITFITGKTDEDSDDDDDDNDDNEDEDENVDADNNSRSEDDDIIDDISEDHDEDVTDDDLQNLSDVDFADVDDDLSDMEFNGSENEDDVDDELISSLNKKLNAKGSKSKEKKGGIDSNIFVSAEKFAEMLEEQNKTRGKHGGSNVFSSSDGASAKQIDWEIKRHQRMKGSFGKKKRKSVQSFDNNQVKRFKRKIYNKRIS